MHRDLEGRNRFNGRQEDDDLRLKRDRIKPTLAFLLMCTCASRRHHSDVFTSVSSWHADVIICFETRPFVDVL